MKLTRILAVGALAVSVAACTNAIDGGGGNTVDLTGSATAPPATAADTASPAYFQSAVGDRVLFEVDQSTLTATARATLDAQAAWLQQHGDIAVDEMRRTFNCGVGMVVIVSEQDADATIDVLESHGEAAFRFGRIVAGSGDVVYR